MALYGSYFKKLELTLKTNPYQTQTLYSVFLKHGIDKTVLTVYTVPIQKRQGRRFGECIHR